MRRVRESSSIEDNWIQISKMRRDSRVRIGMWWFSLLARQDRIQIMKLDFFSTETLRIWYKTEFLTSMKVTGVEKWYIQKFSIHCFHNHSLSIFYMSDIILDGVGGHGYSSEENRQKFYFCGSLEVVL